MDEFDGPCGKGRPSLGCKLGEKARKSAAEFLDTLKPGLFFPFEQIVGVLHGQKLIQRKRNAGYEEGRLKFHRVHQSSGPAAERR